MHGQTDIATEKDIMLCAVTTKYKTTTQSQGPHWHLTGQSAPKGQQLSETFWLEPLSFL